MAMLENILSQEIIQRLGWTLIHFVWQGVAVAVILAIVFRLLRKFLANVRYIVACLALGAIVLLPAATINLVNVSEPITLTSEAAPIEFEPANVEKIAIAKPITQTPTKVELIEISAEASWKEKAVAIFEPALPYMVSGWLLGVFGLSLWHLGGWTQLQRLQRRMVKPVDTSLRTRLKELVQRLGVNKAVGLMESALVQVPTVVGWLKPVILLPASALTGLSAEHIEAILAHELAHIKRHDYLVNILQTVVEILGFYHPAVWWVSAEIRAERENCCDDLAVSITGDSLRYARALTTMEQIRADHPKLAVAATGGSLLDRIRRLIKKDSAQKEKTSWLPATITILLLMSLLIPVSFAMSNREKSEPETILQKPSKFKKTLPNGVTVELVGICEYPSTGKQWWRPDDNRLDSDITTEDRSGYKSKYPGYEIAFKVYGQDYNFRRGSIKGSEQGSTLKVIESEDIFAYRVHIKPGISKTKIRADVAAGKWKTVASHSGHGTTFGKVKNKKVIFSAANESKDGLTMTISDDIDYKNATRLIAINKNGLEYKGQIQASLSVNRMRQQTFAFLNVLLKNIKEFAFQSRPYEYVTFKNVSLKPNFNPDAKIKVKNPGEWSVTAPDKWTRILPNGGTIKLIALFRPKDNPIVFWDPNGTIIEGPKLGKHHFANASGRELAYILQRPERKYEDGHENPAPDGNFYTVHGWKTFRLESNEPLIIKRASGYGDWVDMGQIKETQDLGNYNLVAVEEVDMPRLKHVRAKMFWKFNPDFGIRLVAIDKKGKEYPMKASDGFLGNFRKGQQMLYYQGAMELNKKELSHFKLQRRPLDWATFEDFATEPKYNPKTGEAKLVYQIDSNDAPDEKKQDTLKPNFKPTAQVEDSGYNKEELSLIWPTKKRGVVSKNYGPDIDKIAAPVGFSILPAEIEEALSPRKYLLSIYADSEYYYVTFGKEKAHLAKQYGMKINGKTGHVFHPTERKTGVSLPANWNSLKIIQNNLWVTDINFEPIHQGKNIVKIKVQNKSDKEQVFGIHIYTRSPDYGKHGIGWGRPFFETLKAKEEKICRFAYHIQGPVTENTWLRLKFYNPESEQAYDYREPFQQKRFFSKDLESYRDDEKFEPVSKQAIKTFYGLLETLQNRIKRKRYEDTWSLFTEEYQQVQFGPKGLERFKNAMEPENSMHTAFTWAKEDFLSLKPAGVLHTDNKFILKAKTVKRKTWTIDFVEQKGQWKVDWIAGYTPGVLNIQDKDAQSQNPDVQVEELEKRFESAKKLSNLGRAMLIYANDHDDKYPTKDDLLKAAWLHTQESEWMQKNVGYRGDKVKITSWPKTVLAYDKTMLAQKDSQGTNVLYNDCYVSFEKPDQLEKLGISKTEIEVMSWFFILPADCNEIEQFFEDEKIAFASSNYTDANYANLLNDKQVEQLLKFTAEIDNSKLLTEPKVRVFDGEEAIVRIQKTVKYVSGYEEVKGFFGKPKEKTNEVKTGTFMKVKPKLLPGTDNILLEMELEFSSLIGFQKQIYKKKYSYSLPETEITQVKTKCAMRSGQTLILGGQKTSEEKDGKQILKMLLILVKAERI